MNQSGNSEQRSATVRSWLVEPPPADVKKAVERLARADDVRHIAVMPDVHLAAGVCVGNVIATTRLIYPQAVGGDIGCGMAALAFDAPADVLRDAANARAVLEALREAAPPMRHRSREAAPKLRIADNSVLRLSDSSLIRDAEREGRVELGTLGRGNHFLEFQVDEEDRLWLMLHSGSRHMGQAITAFHAQRATKSASGLWFLDAQSDTGQAYLSDMAWACAYADANRRTMLAAAEIVIKRIARVDALLDSVILCNHNHVRREAHGGRELWIHRKGAISAADGETGIIPGSMGTGSFHVSGRGNADALCSSSHGAGRRMSRDQARRRIGRRDLLRELDGVTFDDRLAHKLCDEAPSAYKDINAVMRAQRDLTRIVRRLRPVLVYKAV